MARSKNSKIKNSNSEKTSAPSGKDKKKHGLISYDWDKYEKEYVESPVDLTLKQMAETYNIPLGTLKTTSSRFFWASKRAFFKNDPDGYYRQIYQPLQNPVGKSIKKTTQIEQNVSENFNPQQPEQPEVFLDEEKKAKIKLLTELQKEKYNQIKEISNICNIHISAIKIFLNNAFKKEKKIDKFGNEIIETSLIANIRDYERITRIGNYVLEMHKKIDEIIAEPKTITLTKQITIQESGIDNEIALIKQELENYQNSEYLENDILI